MAELFEQVLSETLNENLSLESRSRPEIIVTYCSICTLPREYCEFGGLWKECSTVKDIDGVDLKEEKAPSEKHVESREIVLSVHKRGKHKLVTMVKGMSPCLVAQTSKKKTKSEQQNDLKEVQIKLVEISKELKKTLSCGSSVSDGIVEFQGDVVDRLIQEIPKRYGQKYGMYSELISIGKREKFK